MLLSQLQLVIASVQPNFIKRKILPSSQTIGEHGKEETLTGHDGMREINGFLNDAVGSETHRRQNVCN